MIRLVLFDIDGTLILTGGAGEKAFAKVCSTEFNVVNGAERLHFAGRTDKAIARDFFLRHHIEPSESNFRRFFGSYVFWLDQILEQTRRSVGRVLPGVTQLIADLQSLPEPPLLGLLTGNIRLGAEIKLTHFALWKHFQVGAFGDDDEDRNCVAGIARDRASGMLSRKLAGDEIVVIGDTPLDIACANSIGAKSLAVATGNYSMAQLQEQKPTWVLSDLSETSAQLICV